MILTKVLSVQWKRRWYICAISVFARLLYLELGNVYEDGYHYVHCQASSVWHGVSKMNVDVHSENVCVVAAISQQENKWLQQQEKNMQGGGGYTG